MTIKFAYIDPLTREYLYADSVDVLQDVLAKNAAQVYVDHYCNGAPYTIVEVQDDGSEKWYAPTGDAILSPAQLELKIKHRQSFANAGVIPTSILGTP